MALNRITIGIDIGTHQIKVVVAEVKNKNGRNTPTIIGTGFAQSKGLRHGYIINQTDIARSIKTAFAQAQKMSGIKIQSVYLAIGGVGLDEIRAKGEAIVSRGDNEITDLDVEHAIQNSEEQALQKSQNKKIIHSIPISYTIDNERVLGRPQGMKGTKLIVDTLFVTTLEQHLQDLISTIEELGVAVIDVMAAPIAASFVTLTKAQKIAGCVLANIGAETVSIAVFENNIPISVKVFPIGGTDITNDIALGFKISLEEAESVKRGTVIGANYSKRKLDEIISARLSDIFDLIESHLEHIGKNGLLPAGIILTGGGSGVSSIEDIARAALKLPSRTGSLVIGDNTKIKDASWAVSYGLTIWGLSDEGESLGITAAKKASSALIRWIKQFLP
jgi:cell division protein FtsA